MKGKNYQILKNPWERWFEKLDQLLIKLQSIQKPGEEIECSTSSQNRKKNDK